MACPCASSTSGGSTLGYFHLLLCFRLAKPGPSDPGAARRGRHDHDRRVRGQAVHAQELERALHAAGGDVHHARSLGVISPGCAIAGGDDSLSPRIARTLPASFPRRPGWGNAPLEAIARRTGPPPPPLAHIAREDRENASYPARGSEQTALTTFLLSAIPSYVRATHHTNQHYIASCRDLYTEHLISIIMLIDFIGNEHNVTRGRPCRSMRERS